MEFDINLVYRIYSKKNTLEDIIDTHIRQLIQARKRE